MTAPITSTISPTSPKQSGVMGCILTILTILFAILGIYDIVVGAIFTYVFGGVKSIV